MADGVGGVCSHLPQVGRSDQQVGGLARRGELLGEVGTLDEGGERRRGVAGPFVVGCKVAEPAQLVNPLGRDRLQLSGPGRVHRRRLAGQVGRGQDVGQQRVPEPDTLTGEHDDTGVDGFADRPGFGGVERLGNGGQRPGVGRATGDGEDPGDLPRRGRQPSPGVEQRAAQLVGQVVGSRRSRGRRVVPAAR